MLQAFTFGASNQQLRAVTLDGEPYFVAKDVCAILDISNHKDAVSRLDEDEKGRSVIPTQFGSKETNLINESGFYHLIFISRKPQAAAIRKWVTSEVLPSIRRTGRYELPTAPAKPLRYPRRGELITADILHLLWLIGESLHQGDQKTIALELGVTRQSVARVLSGAQRNSRILMALYRRAQANRAADQLYCAPQQAAQCLLGDPVPVPEPERLPAVYLHKGRGAALGRRHTRKNERNSENA